MVFQLLHSKPKQSPTNSGNNHHDHVVVSGVPVISGAKSFETKLLRRPQKLLSKVVRRSRSSKSLSSIMKIPATPSLHNHRHGSHLKTPATTLIHHGHDHPDTQVVKQQPNYDSDHHHHLRTVFSQAVELPYHYHEQQEYNETVDVAILEERERIRQQLFYEEEGVEVTAQYRLYQASSLTTTNATINKGTARSKDQEEKKDDREQPRQHSSSSPKRRSTTATPQTKRKEPELPPTPILDPSEADPVPRFPAVAAAIAAKKQAEQAKQFQEIPPSYMAHKTSLLSGISNASSSQASYSMMAGSTTTRDKAMLFSAHTTATVASTHTVTPVSPSPEKPFDEPSGRAVPSYHNVLSEDPTITEIENATSRESAIYDDDYTLEDGNTKNRWKLQCNSIAVVQASEMNSDSAGDVTRRLLNVFNCGDDFTEFSGSAAQFVQQRGPSSSDSQHYQQQRTCRLVDAFYDNSCWTYREAMAVQRPYYDEIFAQRFLKDITNEGVNVLWHLPPAEDDANAETGKWSGCSVVMKIKPGSSHAAADNDKSCDQIISNSRSSEPKLVWTTLGGGKKKMAARCSVSLLAIQSISTFKETICDRDDIVFYSKEEEERTTTSCGVNVSQMDEADEEDICFFSITTKEGDVQVFEAATPRERDLLVVGLKNVIARLSFHLVVGDAGGLSELYCEQSKAALSPGELPSCSSPMINMNRIAHALMD